MIVRQPHSAMVRQYVSSAETDAAEEFGRRCADGDFDLPLPGGGRTDARFASLRELGRGNLAVARLGEGHADALAILAEAGCERPVGARLGVWAAGPIAELRAEETNSGWRLSGVRRWCSGAYTVTHALVTASAVEGDRLFLVPTEAAGVLPDPTTWPAVGMAGSGTYDVSFDGVEVGVDAVVGGPGFYLSRLGFWIGAIGVAAVWLGGSDRVAATLASRAAGEPHALAHLGAVHARLSLLGDALGQTSTRVDQLVEAGARALGRSTAGTELELLARTFRAEVEAGATEVLDRTGRATGAGPLGHDGLHARRVADLTVYLRQSHAERDLEALGALALRCGKFPPLAVEP